MSGELTRKQALSFDSCTRRNMTVTMMDHVKADDGRKAVAALREAGWTIEPPKPRYRVEYDVGFWKVHEGDRNLWIASFEADSHPDAEAAAQAEADRLNGGDA